MTEQPGLDVFGSQGGGEQGVVHEVDLSDGEVVGGAPVGVERLEFVVGEIGRGGHACLRG